MADRIYFVIPCYNEEEVLPITAGKLGEKLRALVAEGFAADDSRILFVDDGSRDRTWRIIETLAGQDPLFTGLKLAGNRGHQKALLAGLMAAKRRADAVISMDADLQDDVDAAEAFLKAYYEGCDVVYGVRKSRESDSLFKRKTAEWFYKLMRAMGVRLVFNHADYRLMSRRALDCLEQYKEETLFLRGIVPQIGLKSAYVFYDRGERAAGRSKYPFHNMLALALDGITSFSVKPIRAVTVLGLTVFLGAFAALLGISVAALCGAGVSSFAFLVCSVWLLGGVQLFAVGMVGEYIGKIYSEVKGRPRYFVEKDLDEQRAKIEKFLSKSSVG